MFTFFWKGPLSQWYPSNFTIDGIKYNTAEQFMMAEKARMFGDTDVLKSIMSAGRPKDQKTFGRKVKNFDKNKWDKVAKDIVYKGNMAKFKQNPKLEAILLKTKGTMLVEASPQDTIWGIGLDAKDPRAQIIEQWLGTNWLGEVLTQVRDDLLKSS
jgi:ribA/ribD-fused uncharacterized protein